MNEITVPEQFDLQTAALKVPPHSIEAEQAVLGGLMLDNNAWERVLDQVSDGDFYRHDHRLIFPVAVLTAFSILAGAYFVMKNVFYAEGMVSILIEIVGGTVFLIVILRKGRL